MTARTPHWKGLFSLALLCALLAACASTPKSPLVSPPATGGGSIVFRTASAQDADPYEAAKKAAQALRAKMGGEPTLAVLVVDCFDEKSLKSRVLKGVASVFPSDILFGGATYGSFSEAGCLDSNSVGLLAIGGSGVSVTSTFWENLGVEDLDMETDGNTIKLLLDHAGQQMAKNLPKSPQDRLILLMADAHSPKNQFLIEGMHPVVGKGFPITGGSVNKNAGETFVYYRGGMYSDCAFALMLGGDFKVALSGRQAKTNEKVISSAGDGAKEAMDKLREKPLVMFAFNCAGRKGKLDRLEDELEAIQKVVGRETPIFGCYCAGEFGPVDVEEKEKDVLSSGRGWHVMSTLIGRR